VFVLLGSCHDSYGGSLSRIFCRVLVEGAKDGLIMLPSDKALLDDPNTRALVELYAKVV